MVLFRSNSLGAVLIEAPLGHRIYFCRSNKKRLSAPELFLRGAYVRNYTVYYITRIKEIADFKHQQLQIGLEFML